MCFEVSVALEDVKFVTRFIFVVPSVWPGSCMFCGVFNSKIERAQCYAYVEIGKD